MSKILVFENENGKVALVQDKIKIVFLEKEGRTVVSVDKERAFFPKASIAEIGNMIDLDAFVFLKDERENDFYMNKKTILGIVHIKGKLVIVDTDGGGMELSGTLEENIEYLKRAGVING